jgi:OOP family OmpA-OmpF porin
MQKIADFLSRNNATKLNITGHTDNVGNKEYNLALSGQRAENVKNYLVEQLGVNPQRLNTQGVGSAQPAEGNDTPEGRQRNRRVSISGCFVE